MYIAEARHAVKFSLIAITNPFSNKSCNIATVRAGNCFGGGDWTKDRIVKDL